MNDPMISAYIPPSITKYGPALASFYSGMIKKLHLNSWKDTPVMDTVPTIIEKLEGEVAEFKEQFNKDITDENVLMELFDIANFAFLAYVALKQQGAGNGTSSDT